MDDLGVIYDKEISVAMKRIYWDDLGQFPIDALEAAIKAHRRDRDRGRFFPKPADLLARIGGDAAHIPPEAAWAIALESLDENRTVIWTDEIQRAREAARPIWEIGDKYGARMAFVKAYEAILLATSQDYQPDESRLLATLPLQEEKGALACVVLLDGKSVKALLDIAGNFELAMDKPLTSQVRQLTASDLVLRQVPIENAHDLGLGLPDAPRLGRRLLERYLITIDFRQKVIHFERPAG